MYCTCACMHNFNLNNKWFFQLCIGWTMRNSWTIVSFGKCFCVLYKIAFVVDFLRDSTFQMYMYCSIFVKMTLSNIHVLPDWNFKTAFYLTKSTSLIKFLHSWTVLFCFPFHYTCLHVPLQEFHKDLKRLISWLTLAIDQSEQWKMPSNSTLSNRVQIEKYLVCMKSSSCM